MTAGLERVTSCSSFESSIQHAPDLSNSQRHEQTALVNPPGPQSQCPQTEAHLTSQLETLGFTVHELQGDVQHFKEKVRETSIQAARLRTLLSHELSTKLGVPASSAVQAVHDFGLTTHKLAAALVSSLPHNDCARGLLEELLGQLQKQQTQLANNVSSINQALGVLLTELNRA